jgi:hypothetical protein
MIEARGSVFSEPTTTGAETVVDAVGLEDEEGVARS